MTRRNLPWIDPAVVAAHGTASLPEATELLITADGGGSNGEPDAIVEDRRAAVGG